MPQFKQQNKLTRFNRRQNPYNMPALPDGQKKALEMAAKLGGIKLPSKKEIIDYSVLAYKGGRHKLNDVYELIDNGNNEGYIKVTKPKSASTPLPSKNVSSTIPTMKSKNQNEYTPKRVPYDAWKKDQSRVKTGNKVQSQSKVLPSVKPESAQPLPSVKAAPTPKINDPLPSIKPKMRMRNKVALGAVGVGALGGIGYGIYRKVRSDKNKKRGAYRKSV